MLKPILMADDDRDDCLLARRALEKSKVGNPFVTVEDGEELLDYLFRRGKYSDPEKSVRPILILLDLNMPRVKGIEALKEIKADPELCKIPVVVLTTSSQEEDILQCYRNHISGYIVKPVTLAGLCEAIDTLGNYWFNLVQLPER